MHHKTKFEIVKSTGSSIGSLLFQNSTRETFPNTCFRRCEVCSNNLRNENTHIKPPTNGRSYPIDTKLSISNCGIYCISCPCLTLYMAKTTTKSNQRFAEHFQKSTSSAVLEHSKVCSVGKRKSDYSVQYSENIIQEENMTCLKRNVFGMSD